MILKIFFSFLFYAVSFFVHAEYTLKPYLGFDIQQRNMHFKKMYGDNIFARKSLQNNVYTGLRLTENFGLEGGYQSSQKTLKNSMTLSGEYLLGQLVNPAIHVADSGFISAKTSICTQGPYLSLIRFLAFYDDKTEFMTSIGATVLTVKLHYNQVADSFMAAYSTPEDILATTLNFSSTKVIPRCMFGVQRQFSESWGLRASLVYELTGRFKQMAPKNSIDDPNNLLPGNKQLRASLRNSITYGLGVFMTF